MSEKTRTIPLACGDGKFVMVALPESVFARIPPEERPWPREPKPIIRLSLRGQSQAWIDEFNRAMQRAPHEKKACY
jgi:hypothetical protein